MDNKAIGSRIKALRDRMRLSQKAFAQAVGVAHNVTVSRWESGAQSPDLAMLERIAQVTGSSVSYLVGESAGPVGLPAPVAAFDPHQQETAGSATTLTNAPSWAAALLDGVQSLPQAVARVTPPWADDLTSACRRVVTPTEDVSPPLATREDIHSMERAVLRLADEMRELRLTLLAGASKAEPGSASDQDSTLESR